MYLKIKEFSKMANVSVRTLQYYDEIGILNPDIVNNSGHRYYGEQAFERIYYINILKSAGLKLKEIILFLKNDDFDISKFVNDEKIKTQAEIAKLQSKYIFLNSISFVNGYPVIGNHSTDITQIKISDDISTLFFKEWGNFIDKLNLIVEQPSLRNSNVAESVACFWHDTVIRGVRENFENGDNIELYYSKLGNYLNCYGLNDRNYPVLADIYENYKKTYK